MNIDKLILASNSPRRQELLTAAHIDYELTQHLFDENTVNHNDKPINVAKKIAFGKADSLKSIIEYNDKFVLGVDTIVAFGNEIFGKPKDALDAEKIIRKLSGKTHQVISGVCLINRTKNISITKAAISDVTFETLSEEFIKYYLTNKHYEGFAGGYAIQGIFSLVVKNISGSYSNIVGLPMELLYQMLNESEFQKEF